MAGGLVGSKPLSLVIWIVVTLFITWQESISRWTSQSRHMTIMTSHLKLPATWLLAQQHVDTKNKENIKASHYWPFCEWNPPATGGFPSQMPIMRKGFPCHDIIMNGVFWIPVCRATITRDHFVYVLSQWETTLQCNVVPHWLGAYTKWPCITTVTWL